MTEQVTVGGKQADPSTFWVAWVPIRGPVIVGTNAGMVRRCDVAYKEIMKPVYRQEILMAECADEQAGRDFISNQAADPNRQRYLLDKVEMAMVTSTRAKRDLSRAIQTAQENGHTWSEISRVLQDARLRARGDR